MLIADDSQDDRFFFKRAIESDAPRLHVIGEVWNGSQVLAYLSGEGEYADRVRYPFPDLLLLDWRMPFKDGREILEWLKTHPLPRLKVAVLADSSGAPSLSELMELGAFCFFPKPATSTQLTQMIRALQDKAGSPPG